MIRSILVFIGVASVVGCSGGGVSVGTGEPLSSLDNLPDADIFVAGFAFATPISGVDLLALTGVTEACSGGGTAKTSGLSYGGSTEVSYRATYEGCQVSITLGLDTIDETLQGRTDMVQSPSGIHQVTTISLSGKLGLAIYCDVVHPYSGDATGFCKVFDSEGTTIDIALDDAALLI